MLIITRRAGEQIMIGEDIVIEVLEVTGGYARIGVAAPRDIPVHRDEIYAATREEGPDGAAAAPETTV